MLTAPQLRGCYPALITPMREAAGRIVVDTRAFHDLIQHVIDHGVTGFVIAGTTGQSATLTHDEQIDLVNDGALFARGYAAGKGRKIQVIASAGSNATHEAEHLSRGILAKGRVDGLLHVTGYYNNPPQEGLIKHFVRMAEIAGDHGVGVILYNVPTRTRSNIDADTAIELARHEAIIGLKEASGDLDQVQRILDGTDRQTFAMLSGEDHLVAEIIRRGGTGVISASANRWPREFQTLCELALAGEHAKAAELQEALLPCVAATFCVKNPIPMHHMFGSTLRLPLVTIDELREPARSAALAKIAKAEAIESFPHVAVASRPPLAAAPA